LTTLFGNRLSSAFYSYFVRPLKWFKSTASRHVLTSEKKSSRGGGGTTEGQDYERGEETEEAKKEEDELREALNED